MFILIGLLHFGALKMLKLEWTKIYPRPSNLVASWNMLKGQGNLLEGICEVTQKAVVTRNCSDSGQKERGCRNHCCRGARGLSLLVAWGWWCYRVEVRGHAVLETELQAFPPAHPPLSSIYSFHCACSPCLNPKCIRLRLTITALHPLLDEVSALSCCQAILDLD